MQSIIESKYQDNWIVIDLNSIDTENDTYVSLFNSEIDYVNGSSQYIAPVKAVVAPYITITYNGGAEKRIYGNNLENVNNVITILNEEFEEGGGSVFTANNVVGVNFNLTAVSNRFSFQNITWFGGITHNFVASTSQAAAGSRVVVTSESNINMNEISQELSYQPYKLDNIDVYANTLAQANNQIWKATRMANGVEYDDYEQPAVNPIQNQFALIYMQLDYTPSPTNDLIYKVDAGERVRIICRYSHISLYRINEIQVEQIDELDILDLPRFQKPSGKLVELVNKELRKDMERRFIDRNKSDTGIKSIVSGYLFSGKE
jgi:hypothetical protein